MGAEFHRRVRLSLVKLSKLPQRLLSVKPSPGDASAVLFSLLDLTYNSSQPRCFSARVYLWYLYFVTEAIKVQYEMSWQPRTASDKVCEWSSNAVSLNPCCPGLSDQRRKSRKSNSPGLPLCVCEVTSVVSDSLRSHGLWPARLLCPWNSPGRNTGVSMPSSGGSRPKDGTCISNISCNGRRVLYH